MQFTPIDLNSWPRGQMFYYYSKMAPTGYSITVELDVTELKKTTKSKELKFFPAYLWLVTKNANSQVEFKVAMKGEQLGYYDTLTPLYASFHEDDKTFSLMWTQFNENFSVFYNDYINNQTEYGNVHGVLSQPQTVPPENAFVVSCIPWVNFSSFALHSYQNAPYYYPSIEAGKFVEKDGRLFMPLSVTCHHATTDGYHIDKFLTELQDDMNSFGKYL